MMNEFNALVFEFLIEPVCAELEDIARSFPVNCAIEVVEQTDIFRWQTALRRRRCRERSGHGGRRAAPSSKCGRQSTCGENQGGKRQGKEIWKGRLEVLG